MGRLLEEASGAKPKADRIDGDEADGDCAEDENWRENSDDVKRQSFDVQGRQTEREGRGQLSAGGTSAAQLAAGSSWQVHLLPCVFVALRWRRDDDASLSLDARSGCFSAAAIILACMVMLLCVAAAG